MPKLSYAQLDELAIDFYAGFDDKKRTEEFLIFLNGFLPMASQAVMFDSGNEKPVYYIYYSSRKRLRQNIQAEAYVKGIESFIFRNRDIVFFASMSLNSKVWRHVQDVSPQRVWHYARDIITFDEQNLQTRNITL